jgi:AcrR family transcriptional regulator
MNQDSSSAMAAHSLRARFKEAVSDAILDAAEELAAEVGIQNAGLQAIAQKAGVAVGTIYNHFSDRNELFEQVFKRLHTEIITAVDDALKTVASEPFDRAVLTVFDERRTGLRISIDAGALAIKAQASDKPAKAISELQQRAERVVKIGIKEKRLRQQGSELTALFLVSALRMMLIARVDGATSFVKETDTIVSLFLNGAAR